MCSKRCYQKNFKKKKKQEGIWNKVIDFKFLAASSFKQIHGLVLIITQTGFLGMEAKWAFYYYYAHVYESKSIWSL